MKFKMDAFQKRRQWFQIISLPVFVSLYISYLLTFTEAHFKTTTVDVQSMIPPNPLNPGPDGIISKNPNDVHFYLYFNPQDVNASREIILNNTESLSNSGFIANLSTIIIIHGFHSNVNTDLPQMIKNAFISAANGNFENNIIVIDWGKLATPRPPLLAEILYNLATFNVPIVANRISEFIQFLQRENAITLDKIYLIGISLGAHVAGVAGRNISMETGDKIGRITGLDPAGPDFFPSNPEKSLVANDAEFVDVIHTNRGIEGDLTTDGHADFFPNGGSSQPGCQEADMDFSAGSIGSCSHTFSVKLYIASITKLFPSCPCKNVSLSYPLGLCSASCENPVSLGYHCPSTARGEFYLVTSNPP